LASGRFAFVSPPPPPGGPAAASEGRRGRAPFFFGRRRHPAAWSRQTQREGGRVFGTSSSRAHTNPHEPYTCMAGRSVAGWEILKCVKLPNGNEICLTRNGCRLSFRKLGRRLKKTGRRVCMVLVAGGTAGSQPTHRTEGAQQPPPPTSGAGAKAQKKVPHFAAPGGGRRPLGSGMPPDREAERGGPAAADDPRDGALGSAVGRRLPDPTEVARDPHSHRWMGGRIFR